MKANGKLNHLCIADQERIGAEVLLAGELWAVRMARIGSITISKRLKGNVSLPGCVCH